MLYVVLARAFGLPVRAAVVPTHVFVELGARGAELSAPGTKIQVRARRDGSASASLR